MIPLKYVFQQVRKDLIGKDSHRGVSLTYAWIANQFGHFSLGFLPVFFFYCLHLYFFDKGFFFTYESPPYVFGLFVAIFWSIFEAFNFLGPIINNKKETVFKPKWANLAYDTFTDILFFALGAFSASITLEILMELGVSKISKIGFWTVFIVLLIPIKYWYVVRVFQQYSYLPFQFRLSQWSNSINENDRKKIEHFVGAKSEGNHLLIFGGFKSGKTSLGVGIANELAINYRKSTFTSAIKFCAKVSTQDVDPSLDLIWNWQNSELLVIDDVNPGTPLTEEFISAKDFLELMSTDKIRQIVAKKNTVWILGYRDNIIENNWVDMLTNIGVPNNKISIVNLCQNLKTIKCDSRKQN